MNRTEELIKILKEYVDDIKDGVRDYISPYVLTEAANTIEQLAAKVRTANMEQSTAYYNGGWIPVKERLPESGEEVLVWYEYWSDKRESMVQTFGISFYWNTWCGDVMGIKARCIAWMPLPKPYREDDAEKFADKVYKDYYREDGDTE